MEASVTNYPNEGCSSSASGAYYRLIYKGSNEFVNIQMNHYIQKNHWIERIPMFSALQKNHKNWFHRNLIHFVQLLSAQILKIIHKILKNWNMKQLLFPLGTPNLAFMLGRWLNTHSLLLVLTHITVKSGSLRLPIALGPSLKVPQAFLIYMVFLGTVKFLKDFKTQAKQ